MSSRRRFSHAKAVVAQKQNGELNLSCVRRTQTQWPKLSLC